MGILHDEYGTTGCGILVGAAGLVAAICLICMAGAWMFDRPGCLNAWDAAFKPQWGFTTGCTILEDGRRIPADKYRSIAVNS